MNDLSLQNFLLVSDLDGTLVTDKGVIPARNIEAARRFMEKGGRLTFATGRSVMGMLKFTEKVMPNAPILTYNGGCIYDVERQKVLWSKFLPSSASRLIKDVKRLFPDVGIEVYSGQYVYSINKNEHTKAHISFGNLTEHERTIDDIPQDLNKILFCCDNDRLVEVSKYLNEINQAGCVYVFSGPIYFEVLPEGVSKGETVKRLADMLGIPHSHIMAIGDYYNDRELIETAAVGAVPAGAPDDLKQLADLVMGSCENGAVADFIEYIEATYELLDK